MAEDDAQVRRINMTFGLYAEVVNSYRYKEDAPAADGVLGDIYVRKHVLGAEPPSAIAMTVFLAK